jgi:hypothetical protein
MLLATDPSGYSEQLPLWVQFVNAWDNVLGHPRTGWFAQISNGAAGMADTVSLELASRLRQWVGYDDVVDYHSAAYFGGQLVGTGVNLGLGFANPCAMGRTLGQGLRWLTGVQAVGGSINAGENLAAGNYGAAVLDLVGVAGNSFQMRRPCFPGDVQVLTRRGWVRWDALTTNDEVLSLPEDQPQGELAYRRVEEVFGRWGVIWEVAVAERVLADDGGASVLGAGSGLDSGESVAGGRCAAIARWAVAGGRVSARHGPRGGGVQLPSGGVSYVLRRR